MKRISTVLAVVGGALFAIYGSLSLNTVLSGQLDWDRPFALWIAIAAILMVLFIANAAFHFKQEHRRAYGLIQIVIGCAILVMQMGGSGASEVNHGMFAVTVFSALFFLVQGFENWRSGRIVSNGVMAR